MGVEPGHHPLESGMVQILGARRAVAPTREDGAVNVVLDAELLAATCTSAICFVEMAMGPRSGRLDGRLGRAQPAGGVQRDR